LVSIRFVDSAGVLEELRKSIPYASSFKSAVAFLSSEGYREIEPLLLKLLRKQKHAQLVVGISEYGITDWQPLARLHSLRMKYPNLSVKVFKNRGFHPKLFLSEFENGKFSILIGSSNLTAGGMRRNIEANILLEGKPPNKMINEIKSLVDNAFLNAHRLDGSLVDRYRKYATETRNRHSSSKSLRIADTPIRSLEIESSVRSPKIPRVRGRRVWKVAPGWQGWQWPLWEQEIMLKKGKLQGVVAIGWNSIDIGKMPYGNWQDDGPCPLELVTWVRKRLSRNDIRQKTNPRYVARQGARFCKLMRKHDLLVAYSKKTVYGIAEVRGSPFHRNVTDKNALYANRRRVDWLTLLNVRVSGRLVYLFSMPRDTIHEITDREAIKWVWSRIKSSRFARQQ
jgi:HKD family nuclease